MNNMAHIINIAKGLYDEKDLKKPLSKEEKKILEDMKKDFKEMEKVGLEKLVRSYSPEDIN